MFEEILQQLTDENLLTEKQLEEAKTSQLQGDSIFKYLRDKIYIPEEKLLISIADKLNLLFKQNLADAEVPEEFVNIIPIEFTRTYNLIGIKKSDGLITVATANPLETEPIDELEGMLGCEVETVISTRSEIAALINRSYVSGGNVEEMLEGVKTEELMGIAEQIDESEDVLNIAYKAPIVKLVNMLFFEALRMRASDIHLQPYEDKLQVRYRIDGILHNTQVIPKKVQDAVISRIKVMGKMDIAERRLPQDGRTSIRVGDAEVDVRISSVPTSYGERIVMRLLDKSAK
ncbi:MAG: ATPase, T2SS/T4P/T4SS family, partial [Planctomycetota bacterium]